MDEKRIGSGFSASDYHTIKHLCLDLEHAIPSIPYAIMIISSRAQNTLLFLVIFAGFASAACKPPSDFQTPQEAKPQAPSTAPTSFCKCTCFTNSTIIPLDAPSSANRPYTDPGNNLLVSRRPAEPNDDGAQEPVETPGNGDTGGEKDGSEEGRKEYRAGNCNDCNRQFCLDYNLPICHGAGMDDVFTTCFRK